jgi:hypothetical protein
VGNIRWEGHEHARPGCNVERFGCIQPQRTALTAAASRREKNDDGDTPRKAIVQVGSDIAVAAVEAAVLVAKETRPLFPDGAMWKNCATADGRRRCRAAPLDGVRININVKGAARVLIDTVLSA